MRYYSLKNILKKNAHFNVIYGERSNGKTFAVLEKSIKDYFADGSQLGLIRRWRDDFTGKRGAQMFDGVVDAGVVKKYSKGQYDTIVYYSFRWYMAKWNEDEQKAVRCETPFAFAFPLSSMEHDKSTSYPKINNILFDEFLTRGQYLPDEFILFMNTLSTIIRNRNSGITIFMLGNTVNKYSPYFTEMGIDSKKIEQGQIVIYKYGDSDLTVAVEHTAPTAGGKGSDVYFAFNNPHLQMIKNGSWEIDIYPHLPIKFRPKDIILTYFIIFDSEILQCEIIEMQSGTFTYIHRKSGEIKNPDTDIVYQLDYDYRPNYHRNILRPVYKWQQKILQYFKSDSIYYQDNEVGEIIRNYLNWCKSV